VVFLSWVNAVSHKVAPRIQGGYIVLPKAQVRLMRDLLLGDVFPPIRVLLHFRFIRGESSHGSSSSKGSGCDKVSQPPKDGWLPSGQKIMRLQQRLPVTANVSDICGGPRRSIWLH